MRAVVITRHGGLEALEVQERPEPACGPGEVRISAADATVQVWSFGKARNTKDRQAVALQGEILMYRGHAGPVTSVTWSPEGQYIASGSEDGTVQIWRAV